MHFDGPGEPMTPTYQIHNQPPAAPSMSIIYAVADALGTGPLEIPPLGESIDPTIIDLCIEDDFFAGTLEFEYNGIDITLDAEGQIIIE